MVEDALWQETARQMMTMLYKLAWSMVHSDADAQDAVQQALLRCWERRQHIGPDAIRTYFSRAVINVCRDMLRKQKRLIQVADFSSFSLPRQKDDHAVIQAIYALPENLRLPLYLKYLQGLSEKEGARVLHLTVPAFRSRLHRARKQLSALLEKEVELG